MIYTNTDNFGSNLMHVLDEDFRTSNEISIASGYTSLDVLNRYRDDFLRVAQDGGTSRLLVGMAFYEGLSQRKLDMLNTLSHELQTAGQTMRSDGQSNGVYVCYVRKFHGKIYQFGHTSGKKIYIGSSNFSRSGLADNIEATIPVGDEGNASSISSFMNALFDPEMSVVIEKADIIVPGSASFRQKMSVSTLSDLQRYDPASINVASLPYFDYPLSRIATSEKSSLNVYFGKGRWSRSTDRVVPRDWYEVELISNRDISSLDIYPKGDFTAYTDDGYVLPMKTSGDYFKNIRSQGNLKLLGMWIKKKLQDSGALIPLTPVTQDTLDQYGRDSIRFHKITDNKFYIEF